MQFNLIAKLFDATASAINKRKEAKAARVSAVRPVAEVDEFADQLLPRPRHVHDPLYKRQDETLRTIKLTNNLFENGERQSKSRWVMGCYTAGSSPITVTTRSTMPEESDEFSHYISATLKKNILDRYVETTGSHVIEPNAFSQNPFVQAQAEEQVSYANDKLYRCKLEQELPVSMDVAFNGEEEFKATVGDSDSNLIFLPDTGKLSGFAKLIARRKRIATSARREQQSITADYSEYQIEPVEECVLPWGEVQVLEDLQPVPLSPCELPSAVASLVEPNERKMTVKPLASPPVEPASTQPVAEIAEVQRMLREFDDLDYIQYILSANAELKVLERIAEQSQTPPIVLAQLAFRRELSVRCAVAENAHTPMEAQWLLVLDEDPTVRYALAENFHLPSEVLNVLAADENGYVSSRAHKTIGRMRPTKVIAASFGKSKPVRKAVAG